MIAAARTARASAWRASPLALLAVITAGLATACTATSAGQPAGATGTGTGAGTGSAAASDLAPNASASTSASTVGTHPVRRSSPRALSLLRQAAEAAVLTSYQGQEITFHQDAGGGTYLITDVSHTSAGATITQTRAAGPSEPVLPYASWDQDGRKPEGVLGITTTLVALLVKNYIVTYDGSSTADNRPADVVQAWRGDNTLAAQFWLDSSTRLPLQREVIDRAGHLTSHGVFVNVRIGKSAGLAPLARTRAALAWARPVAPRDLTPLARSGWVVPPALPGGLTLFAGGQENTGTGPVLDLAYSDGLYVVSVFEQHGRLAPRLAGWQQTRLNGIAVYAAVPDQGSFAWTGNGTVYTLIADAPVQVVADTVRTLPHDRPPGFWRRVGHGLARLADLVNPFS